MHKIVKPFLGIILIVVAGASHALASLPPDVNGEKLPSLAPMLQKVIPGVVNIATESRTVVKQSPLFDDPIFRHFFDTPAFNKPQRYLPDSGIR